MKIHKRHILLLIILLIAFLIAISVLYRYKSVVYAQLDRFKLIPINEHFTELYFGNHSALPRQIIKGKAISFSFTIHNLEGQDTQYAYLVYFKSGEGDITAIDRNALIIKDNESKTILASYTFRHQQEKGTVFVELPEQKQEIHFLMGNKE